VQLETAESVYRYGKSTCLIFATKHRKAEDDIIGECLYTPWSPVARNDIPEPAEALVECRSKFEQKFVLPPFRVCSFHR